MMSLREHQAVKVFGLVSAIVLLTGCPSGAEKQALKNPVPPVTASQLSREQSQAAVMTKFMVAEPINMVDFEQVAIDDLRTRPFAQKMMLHGELRMAYYAAMTGPPGSAIRGQDPTSWAQILLHPIIWPLDGTDKSPWPIHKAREPGGPQLVLSDVTTGYLAATPWDEGKWGVPHELSQGNLRFISEWWEEAQADPDVAYWGSVANGLVRTIEVAAVVLQARPESPQAAFDLLQIGVIGENMDRMKEAYPTLQFYRSTSDDTFGFLMSNPLGHRIWLYSSDKKLGRGYGCSVRGGKASDIPRIDLELSGMELWADLDDLTLPRIPLSALVPDSGTPTAPEAASE